jgi:predicted small lipoprotein YifL
MRTVPLTCLAALALLAACGQKGPLVLRPKPPATPVVIRTPAPAAPAPATPPPEKPADEQGTPPRP